MNIKIITIFAGFSLAVAYFVQSPALLGTQLVMNNELSGQDAVRPQNIVPSISGVPLQKIPQSLANLDHGVHLQVDEYGHLIVNKSIKELFEFYLSAIGEEPLEQVIARIEQQITSMLQAPASTQALLLLKNYIDYKTELSNVENNIDEYLDPLEKMILLKKEVLALRQSYFLADSYSAFFKEDDEYDDFMLKRLSINQDKTLDANSKQQQLLDLDKSLPVAMQAQRQRVMVHGELYASAKILREQGASDESIYNIREEALGHEAATALAQLDDKKKVWKSRLQNYAVQRDSILASSLAVSDKAMAINELIEMNFSQLEGLRVRALNNDI